MNNDLIVRFRMKIRNNRTPSNVLKGISKDEVIYFGDKDVDILAAENAGIDMVVVKWGQGNDNDYANPYPLRAIDSPNDILDFAN